MSQPELEKRLGKERAHALWTLAENAKQTIHHLCAEHNIDIDYQPGIIAAYHRARYLGDAHQYCDILAKQYNYEKLEPLSKEQLSTYLDSPAYHGGVLDHGAGHIHALKLAQGLGQIASNAGAAIYEKSQVRSVENNHASGVLVRTASGSVKAKHLVYACNGYLGELNTTVQQRVMPINNFIIVTEPLGELADQLLPKRHAVFDSRFVVNYFRLTKDNRLLFGGGENYSYQFPSNIPKLVSKALLPVFPQLKDVSIDYAWGGTLAITRSRLPHVVKLSEHTYSASGYSGHGVALAVESGKAIAKAIAGDSDSFDTLKDLPCSRFPGGSIARQLSLAGAMTWYSMLDRL